MGLATRSVVAFASIDTPVSASTVTIADGVANKNIILTFYAVVTKVSTITIKDSNGKVYDTVSPNTDGSKGGYLIIDKGASLQVTIDVNDSPTVIFQGFVQ